MAQITVVRCGTLFDGTGRDPVRDAVVLVQDGRVAAAGPAASTEVPREAPVVDLRGRFVMPGLVDAHSHASIIPGEGDQIGQLCQPPVPQALRAVKNLRRDLQAGTTTMRVMAEEHFLDVDLRRAVEAGTVPGPRLLVATRGITASNGHGRTLTGFDGPDAVRRGIRENFQHGADFIKIFATGGVSSVGTSLGSSVYSREEVRAAVEEADRVGRYVAAHAHGGAGLRLALEEGVATIEHGALMDDQDLQLLLDKRAWLVATLSILFHPEGIEKGDASRPAIMEKVRRARDVVAERFPRVLRAGVRLAVGTDSMHGEMPFELEMLVRFGLSPTAALVAATRGGAEACRIDGETGTLTPGKRADLIALEADPLADITALRRVCFVMKDGRTAP